MDAGRTKGISNIISTVLLIAVTLSIVGLLSSWAPGLFQDTADATSDQTNQQVNCNEADLNVLSAQHQDSGDYTTVVVRNTGTMELNTVIMEAWRNNMPLNSTNTSISSGNFETKNITTTEEPTSIRVISRDCSNAQDRFEDIN